MPDKPVRDTSALVARQRQQGEPQGKFDQDRAIEDAVYPQWPQPTIPLPRDKNGSPIVSTLSGTALAEEMVRRAMEEEHQSRDVLANLTDPSPISREQFLEAIFGRKQ